MGNWSDFGLKNSLLASGQTGAKAQPDRDITNGKSQGGLGFRNEESGQKLTSYQNTMKILTFYYTHKPGGLCKRLYRAQKALIDAGHEVHFVTLDRTSPSPAHLHTIPFLEIPKSGLLFWFLFILWAPLYCVVVALKEKPERFVLFGAIYGALSIPGRTALLLSGTDAPIIVFLRSLVFQINRITRKNGFAIVGSDLLEKAGLYAAAKIVVMSEAMKKELVAFADVSPSHISILPNEIPTIEPPRTYSPSTSGALSILCAGVFDERKNGFYLLEAARLVEKTKPHSLKIIFAGDGPLLAMISLKARELTATEFVFTGWVDSILPIIETSDLLVHPSLHEGGSNVVLEALGSNTPVLLSDIPEHRELLPLDEVFFSLADPKTLAEKLTKFIEHRENLSALQGSERSTASRLFFDWNHEIVRTIIS